jgi:hypothetical protein
MKLATFTLPSNLKRGLDNLATYLIMATEALYAAYEGVKEDVKLGSLQEGTEHMQAIIGIIKPTIDSMVALAEYERAADLPDRMANLADDLFLAILNVNDVYKAVGTKIGGSRLVNLGSLEEGAGHINSIIGVIVPTIEALQILGEYKTGNLVEVMDVFEADFLYMIDRIGQLADKISDIGLLKAQLFEQNAIGINNAIKSGIAAIQESATAMIGLDTGGSLLTVLGPQAITMQGLTSGSPRSYSFAIEFNNVSIGNDMDLEVVANTLADAVASRMEGL